MTPRLGAARVPLPSAMSDARAKTANEATDFMKPKTETTEQDSRSLNAVLGDTEGQTLNRPTEAGWWWWLARSMRTGKDEWSIVHVESYEWAGETHLFCHSQGMSDGGEAGRSRVWCGLWAGPLTPPVSPNDEVSHGSAEKKL